jgi:DNA-binding PadR family transcriptional regulator
MSRKRHIAHTENSLTVQRTNKRKKNMGQETREVQSKLMKGLLDLVILQFLNSNPMHGYQIISSIRKNFGVYFGPSTIYPLLNSLEEKGYIKSQWDLSNERPRKVYELTNDGQALLNFTENSLNHICRKISNISISKNLMNGVNGVLQRPICSTAIKPPVPEK